MVSPYYCVFRRFRQAEFAYGGLILSPSQFLLLPQLLQKVKLALKLVKIDFKNNYLTTLI